MAPRRATTVSATSDLRVLIKLIVPDDVGKRTVVDFFKGRTDWVASSVAEAIASLLEGRGLTTCKDELLTHRRLPLLHLHLASEDARLYRGATTTGKHS